MGKILFVNVYESECLNDVIKLLEGSGIYVCKYDPGQHPEACEDRVVISVVFRTPVTYDEAVDYLKYGYSCVKHYVLEFEDGIIKAETKETAVEQLKKYFGI